MRTNEELAEAIRHSYPERKHFDKFREELIEAKHASVIWEMLRNERARAALIDECADVLIMVHRVLTILDADEEHQERIRFKLEREIERIDARNKELYKDEGGKE